MEPYSWGLVGSGWRVWALAASATGAGRRPSAAAALQLEVGVGAASGIGLAGVARGIGGVCHQRRPTADGLRKSAAAPLQLAPQHCSLLGVKQQPATKCRPTRTRAQSLGGDSGQ